MSKKKSVNRKNPSELTSLDLSVEGSAQPEKTNEAGSRSLNFGSIKKSPRWWTIALVCLLTLSATGAALKYAKEARSPQNAENELRPTAAGEQNQSSNPNSQSIPEPAEAATNLSSPQLSKEYIYAGSRMIAIEEPAPLGTTAAMVTVSGRLTNAKGRGIRGGVVTMTDAQGTARTAISSITGRYQFTDVATGGTYTLIATGKRQTFSPPSRVVNVTEDLSDADFVSNH